MRRDIFCTLSAKTAFLPENGKLLGQKIEILSKTLRSFSSFCSEIKKLDHPNIGIAFPELHGKQLALSIKQSLSQDFDVFSPMFFLVSISKLSNLQYQVYSY